MGSPVGHPGIGRTCFPFGMLLRGLGDIQCEAAYVPSQGAAAQPPPCFHPAPLGMLLGGPSSLLGADQALWDLGPRFLCFAYIHPAFPVNPQEARPNIVAVVRLGCVAKTLRKSWQQRKGKPAIQPLCDMLPFMANPPSARATAVLSQLPARCSLWSLKVKTWMKHTQGSCQPLPES